MDSDQYRQRAAELHALIVGSSQNDSWAAASTRSARPEPWQADVIAKILTLTAEREIHYLSTAMPDDDDWDIVAFTDTTVVRVAIIREGSEVVHAEAVTFARTSLETLELLDVAPIPDDSEPWPSDVNLLGHYRSATVNLPLDKFASPDNRRDLVRFLNSLLNDLEQ